MSNMSYCRFHNTLMDIEDCFDTLKGENNGIESEQEKSKAKRMLIKMVNFLYNENIIDDTPVDFKARINEMVDNCNGDDEEDEE